MRGRLVLVAAVWLALVALGQPFAWVTRQAPFWGMAEGAGKRVVVGDGGLLLVSQGASPWQAVGLGSPADLGDVAFGGGRFVAVGDGMAYLSTDGEVWRGYALPGGAFPRDVVYGSHGFLAGGEGGLWLSPTGERWQRVDRRPVRFLAHGGGVYLAFAERQVAVSRDGRVWQWASLPEEVACAAHGGRTFLALGERLYTSVDGLSWKPLRHSGPKPSCPLAVYKGRFYALSLDGGASGGRILSSADGAVWRAVSWPPLPEGADFPLGLWVGSEEAWVLAGDPMTGGEGLWRFRAGRWTESLRASVWAYSLTYARGVFVGTGPYGGGYWSKDGLVWNSVTIDPDLKQLGNVVYGPQGFLTYDAVLNRIYRSADGSSWRRVGEISGQAGRETLILGLGTHPQGYLAYVQVSGEETLLFSPDGRSWGPFRGRFGPEDVALGEKVRLALWKGVVHRLENGRWQPVPDPQEGSALGLVALFRPRGLAYGRGYFAALTLGGEVLVSQDGRGWRQVWKLPSLEGMDLAFGAGRFVAVGTDRGVAVLATSP